MAGRICVSRKPKSGWRVENYRHPVRYEGFAARIVVGVEVTHLPGHGVCHGVGQVNSGVDERDTGQGRCPHDLLTGFAI